MFQRKKELYQITLKNNLNKQEKIEKSKFTCNMQLLGIMIQVFLELTESQKILLLLGVIQRWQPYQNYPHRLFLLQTLKKSLAKQKNHFTLII